MALPSPCRQGALPKGAGRGEDRSSPPSTTAHPATVPELPRLRQGGAARVRAVGENNEGDLPGPGTDRLRGARIELRLRQAETSTGYMAGSTSAETFSYGAWTAT